MNALTIDTFSTLHKPHILLLGCFLQIKLVFILVYLTYKNISTKIVFLIEKLHPKLWNISRGHVLERNQKKNELRVICSILFTHISNAGMFEPAKRCYHATGERKNRQLFNIRINSYRDAVWNRKHVSQLWRSDSVGPMNAGSWRGKRENTVQLNDGRPEPFLRIGSGVCSPGVQQFWTLVNMMRSGLFRLSILLL